MESLDSFGEVNTVELSKVVTIHDCWNSTGNQSLDICGPQGIDTYNVDILTTCMRTDCSYKFRHLIIASEQFTAEFPS